MRRVLVLDEVEISFLVDVILLRAFVVIVPQHELCCTFDQVIIVLFLVIGELHFVYHLFVVLLLKVL